MLTPGKRPLYVITYLSRGDDTTSGVYLATRNKKEAMRFFKWLYMEWVREQWVGDDELDFYEHNLSVHENENNQVSGDFYFSNDDYNFDGILTTIYTDVPWGWRGPNNAMLTRYQRWVEVNEQIN